MKSASTHYVEHVSAIVYWYNECHFTQPLGTLIFLVFFFAKTERMPRAALKGHHIQTPLGLKKPTVKVIHGRQVSSLEHGTFRWTFSHLVCVCVHVTCWWPCHTLHWLWCYLALGTCQVHLNVSGGQTSEGGAVGSAQATTRPWCTYESTRLASNIASNLREACWKLWHIYIYDI